MPQVTAEKLHTLVQRILVAAGADQRNADRVAEALVSSNLSGVDTHGVFHLPRYVREVQEGTVVATAWPEIVSETPSTALVTGNWTFGHVVAKYAMEVAIQKASAQNVAVVSFVRSTHIGRLGEYSEMAASSGMVSFVLASGYGEETPFAVPFGGRVTALSTNPIAMGFPAGQEPAMVVDFATTTIAGSKVRIAKKRGEPVPPGSLVDKDGKPTTDPSRWPEEGGLLPFGAHKGYAIMLANEFLGRVLSGADAFAEDHRGGPIMRHQGVTLIVFKADLFQPFEEFASRADELQRRMRAIPPAIGFEEVLVPGDLENRARVTRKRDSIPIPDDVWSSLTDLAASLHVRVG